MQSLMVIHRGENIGKRIVALIFPFKMEKDINVQHAANGMLPKTGTDVMFRRPIALTEAGILSHFAIIVIKERMKSLTLEI